MKKLFLIDGAAGTGKTDLIQYVHDKYSNANIVPKYTTRRLRDYESHEDLDLVPISEEKFEAMRFEDDTQYNYGGHKSMVSLEAI